MCQFLLGTVLIVSLFSLVCLQENDVFLERLGKITEDLVSYQRCRLDNDCGLNSFCYGNDNANNRTGYCKCQSGFELLLRNRTYYACRKLAVYNEECEFDIQCVDDLGSLARCNNGICGCMQGSTRYEYDRRCHDIILLGDFCRTDGNCVLENGYAYCVDGRCECNIGYAPSLDKKRCVASRTIGQNCSENDECAGVSNTVCREVCRCQTGYVISRNTSTCLKAATYFFEPCDENDQCSAFLSQSICSGGNCTCQIGRHGYENRCVRSSGIGQGCRGVEECIFTVEQSSIVNCVDGLCQCLPGAVDETLGCFNGSSPYSLYNFSIIYMYTICYLLLKAFL